MLVYFFIYFVRVRGYSFGMATLFGGIGGLLRSVKGLFTKKEKTTESQA